jgi:UDP-glucose 4-epimerase
MKYLITGGAGFIGSHLAEELLNQGYGIRIFDDFSTGSKENLKEIFNLSNVEIIAGSILDKNLISQSFEGIDGCFHMAAAVGVEKILKDPIGSLKTNIHGTENVLEAAVISQVPILLASTSEIYGKNSSGPLSEDSDRIIGSPLLSRWTYSEAKALDESLARALYEKSGLKVKIIRYFNTVGPRQSAAYGMVIPKFFKAAISGEALLIHGKGEQRRVFCHVKDAVNGTLALWNSKSGFGEAFNLGGVEEVRILDLAQNIIKLCESNSTINYLSYDEMRKSGFEDIERRIPNTEKLRKLTGWSPEKSLGNILNDYLEFIKKK